MKHLFKKIVPASLRQKRALRKHRNQSTEGDTATIFTKIYNENKWGTEESVSGPGSSISGARNAISALESFIDNHSIRSILDIPCGDIHWIQKLNLEDIEYTGADIVEELIKQNRIKHPTLSFEVQNIIEDKLPRVDLIICRDCLVHLPIADILKSLQNIKKSGATYVAFTHFEEEKNNLDIITGMWRSLNMKKPPFNLPDPVFAEDEYCPEEYKKQFKGKKLAFWKVEDIPDYGQLK